MSEFRRITVSRQDVRLSDMHGWASALVGSKVGKKPCGLFTKLVSKAAANEEG
jgi:hypothetical protein